MITGIQISSFRPVLTTEQEVFYAFGRIKAMGCGMVQAQWIDPAVTDEAVRDALSEYSLECVSTQDKTEEVLARLKRVLKQNRLWGSRDICVSGIPEAMRSAEGVKELADSLNSLIVTARDNGQTLSFHPLGADYAPIGGVSGLKRIMDGTGGGMRICLDVYHALNAGQDIPVLLREYTGLVDSVHCKEHNAAGELVPVGRGATDWKTILPCCESAGVRYAFAEQEKWDGDPFSALEESFHAIRGLIRGK